MRVPSLLLPSIIAGTILLSSSTSAFAADYVRCGSGSNALCRSDFPICCNGFCASAGDKCCTNSHTCDPGQECCTSYDDFDNPVPDCCDVGSYCGPRGCVKDVCASITDPGVCVSQFNSTMNQTLDKSLCSWCCDSQVCVPTAAAGSVCAISSTINTPYTECPDSCAMFGTCDECTLANSCLWDSSSQQCFKHGSSKMYNPYAVVSTPDSCRTILYWGTGINPENGLNFFGSGSRIVFIIFGVLFATCIVALCISGARVAMLVNRTSAEWEEERDQRAETIAAAVPRYGFAEAVVAEDEDKKKSRKRRKQQKRKNFRTPLLSRNVSSTSHEASNATSSNSKKAIDDDEDDDTVCHYCHEHTQHESRRRFVTAGDEPNAPNKASTVAATWEQVVLLPCYHRVCKRCILRRAEANAAAVGGFSTARLVATVKGMLGFFGVSNGKRSAAADSQYYTRVNSTGSVDPDSQRLRETGGDGGSSALNNTEVNNSMAVVGGSQTNNSTTAAAPTTTSAGTTRITVSQGSSNTPPNPSSAQIRRVIDTADVAEEALISILAGRTVQTYVDDKARREQLKAQQSNAGSPTAGNSGGTTTSATPRANPAASLLGSTTSSDESEGVTREKNEAAVAPAKCPVCDCEVEVIFIPGKVLR